MSKDKCPQWRLRDGFLEVVTGKSLPGGGCVSKASFNVKVVKPGRLRFTYSYELPNDLASSMLLFSFHHRNYDDAVSSDQDSENLADDPADYDITFPTQTSQRKEWSNVDLKLKRPGFYSFMWRSVTIGTKFRTGKFSKRDTSFLEFNDTVSNQHVNLSKRALSSNSMLKSFEGNSNNNIAGSIRIKSIALDGVAYASECTPCDAGSYATTSGAARCQPCPRDTFADSPGHSECRKCDTATHYSPLGSNQCLEKPNCGMLNLYPLSIIKN